MGKTNFQYDETGKTYYYVFLTFLGLILFPATYILWPFAYDDSKESQEKRRKLVSNVSAKGTGYYEACVEKASRMTKKDPWGPTKKTITVLFLLLGWILLAMVLYQISQLSYELANFDPYEILEVSYDATAKEIKKKFRELSLKYHPDKPTGNEKLFMKLTKAYDALTDETAKYNWEHYGNPDGPQAMQFGIGLPAWIVEEKNSIWVLGVYTMVFMIGLPTVVYYWWSNSSKFSGEQVLLDTTQLYYYFFHKTPHMMLKRVLMVLAASLEFERGHNSEIVERPTDNTEIPQLIKHLPNLGINYNEKPLCFSYSIKARSLLFAHLSRVPLPMNTLHLDRLYIIQKGPFLIHEMVTCISQLIVLAHAGRIGRLPSLDTVEAIMKLSPLIVQALWDKKSPLLQLPHIEDEHLKHFHSRKWNIKGFQQLAKMKDEDRQKLLRSLSDEQYKDVIRVLSILPILSLSVTTEVVDDDEQHVVTAGSIITVTIVLERKTMKSIMDSKNLLNEECSDGEDAESSDTAAEEDSETNPDKKKTPVWKKPLKKKAAKKPGGGKPGGKSKPKPKVVSAVEQQQTTVDEKSGPSDEESASESDNENERVQSNVDSEEDEAEWERFQKKMNKREKALEGRSRVSHSVHAPYFTDDKQEFWWCYIADRKSHALVTPPYHVTSLIEREEVELRFTAPPKPGIHTFTVCVRSDSYLGVDHQEDLKLDVHEAREAPEKHPQWEFEGEEEDDNNKDDDSDDDYATDDEYDDEIDDEE